MFKVTIIKEMRFEVDARTADEAKAYALVTADGSLDQSAKERVKFVEKILTVKACE